MTAKITNIYEHKPASGGKPKQIVMLLHGLGADGKDLLGLAPHWAKALPDALFISPDAPYRCDMAPMGYQWFSLQEWTHEARLRGVIATGPILQAFITEQLKKHDVPASKLALVGFSQGTMMSLYAGPRYPEKIAGVLGYSGALIWEEDVDVAKMHKVPVHLVHGEADTVVPVDAYHMAHKQLGESGFTVSGYTTPGLPHSIDERGLQEGGAFLKAILA